ncbi:hypothetical protein PAXRUDRAFT_830596, partial [Paxillus rubicundulus Ve08.2h10]
MHTSSLTPVLPRGSSLQVWNHDPRQQPCQTAKKSLCLTTRELVVYSAWLLNEAAMGG